MYLFQALQKQHRDELEALQTAHDEKYSTLIAEARTESDEVHSAELTKLKEETAKAVEQLKAVQAVEIQSVHESGESIIATVKGEFILCVDTEVPVAYFLVLTATQQNEINILRNDFEAAKADLAKSKAHEEELSHVLSTTQASLSEAQETAKSAQDALSHAQKALSDQEEKLNGLSSDNSELLHSELDKSMAEAEELKVALNRTQEDMASELDWTREQHRKEVEEMTKKYVARETELRKEMEKLAVKPKEMGEELQKELDHDRKELQGKIDAVNEEVIQLKEQSNTSQHTVLDILQPLQDQVEMLKSQIEILEKDIDRKDEEMKELHLANTSKLSEVEAEHRREIERLMESKMALEQQLAERWVNLEHRKRSSAD